MNKPLTLVAAAALSSAAFGDVTIDFEDFTASGFSFSDYGEVSGTLTAIEGDFTMVAPGENFTWASDLTILIASADLSVIELQAGGYSTIGAPNRYEWAGGASGDAGTVIQETITIDGDGVAVDGLNVWLGNGYGSGGPGVWTGSITLVGIDAVPAPGALALLGLAGMGRRRRS